MSTENNGSLWDLKRAISMCKWVAPSPLPSRRGMHDEKKRRFQIDQILCHEIILILSFLISAIKGRTTIELLKKDSSSLGLTISGGVDKDGKPRVAQLKTGSLAQKADVLDIGDILLGINGIKTAGLKHEQVIDLIKQVGEQLTLDIEYDLPKWRMYN
jgi:C-terminal processing protease CtpA/Prc